MTSLVKLNTYNVPEENSIDTIMVFFPFISDEKRNFHTKVSECYIWGILSSTCYNRNVILDLVSEGCFNLTN